MAQAPSLGNDLQVQGSNRVETLLKMQRDDGMWPTEVDSTYTTALCSLALLSELESAKISERQGDLLRQRILKALDSIHNSSPTDGNSAASYLRALALYYGWELLGGDNLKVASEAAIHSLTTPTNTHAQLTAIMFLLSSASQEYARTHGATPDKQTTIRTFDFLDRTLPLHMKKGAKFVFDKIPSSATAEGFFELLAKGNLYGRKWKSGKKQDEEKVTVSVIYNKVTSASADARNFVVIYSDADLPNPAFKLASHLWSKKIVPAATSYKYALQSGSLPSKLDSSNWPRVMYAKKLGATNSNTFISTLARLLWADANAVKGFHIGADTPSTPEDQHLKTRGYPVRVTP